jgi:hypothetical protein
MGVLSDQEDMMKPLEPALNAAIILMTHRLLPAGYRVAEEAPSTYEAIASHLDSGNQMVVYSGGSENTIYEDRQVNYAFRAWHDWCHWTGKVALDMEGEVEACQMQCHQLYDVFGFNAQTFRWSTIIKAEVIGQATYYERYQRFPTNQRMFVEHYLANPEIAFINPNL